MNKFTPGPWRYHEGAIVGSEDVHTNGFLRNSLGISSASYSEMVCAIHGYAEPHTDPLLPTVPRANAALIAQAPAMLEALTAIDGALRMKFSGGDVLDENSPIRDSIMDILAALRAAGAIE